MSDNSCFVGIGAVLAPLEKLLVESFGRVFGLATFGLSADAYSGGADGSVLPFSFNDISATAAARVYKLLLDPRAGEHAGDVAARAALHAALRDRR